MSRVIGTSSATRAYETFDIFTNTCEVGMPFRLPSQVRAQIFSVNDPTSDPL
jgi:hypothetical protein